MREIKQNTDVNVKLFLIDESDHVSGKTGLTLAVELCKDNESSFSTITTAASATEIANGWYNINLTIANNHTNTLGDLIVRATATGADATGRLLNIVANVEADTYGKIPSSNITDYKADISSLALETSLDQIKGIGFDTNQHSLKETRNTIG